MGTFPFEKFRFSKRKALGGFYKLPVLNETTFQPAPKRVQRMLSENTYNVRSAIHVDPEHYVRFYTRSVLSSAGVNQTLGTFLSGVARVAFSQIKKDFPKTSDSAIRYHVLDSLYHGKASVDAVFGDLFRMLFEGVPLNSLQANTSVSEHLMEIAGNPTFQEVLMPACKGNALLSTMTVLNVLQGSKNQFGESAAKDVQNDQDAQQEDGENEDNNEGDGEQQGSDQDDQDDGEGNGQGDQQGGDEDQNNDNDDSTAEEQQDRTDASLASASKMGHALQGALKKAKDKVERSSDAPKDAMTIAGELAGDQFRETLQDISQIGVVVSLLENMLLGKSSVKSDITNVFDLVGRFRGVESEALTVSSLGDGEMVDVTMGGDIERVLPSEYLNLAIPEMQMTFFAKLLEGGLLEAERHGYDEAGFGPVIIMLDVSGSMNGSINYDGTCYTKQTIAAAFTMSMIQHCISQHRDCLVIPFQSDADIKNHAIFSRGLHKSKGQVLIDIDKISSLKSDGGTSFPNALHAIPALLKKYPHVRFEQADVIFFSDGEGYSSDEANAKSLRQKVLPPGSRVFGLFVVDSYYKDQESKLKELEEQNSFLFDVCVATFADGLRDALKRLYKEVIERGFYHIDQQY